MTPEKYKSERTKRGLSQAALAALVGVSRGCINYREAGHDRYPITREAWLAVQSLPLPKNPRRPKKRTNRKALQRRAMTTPAFTLDVPASFAAAHGSPSLITSARELQAVPGAERSGGSFFFYIGIERIAHLFRFPRCFVSINAIRRRKSPINVNDWIMDSGAFTEVTTHGGYRTEPEIYAQEIERWRLCGNMEAAVCQDYMCEPFVTAKTGLTVRDHQRLTIERFDRLRAATDAPLMPVLQGYKPDDYRRHLEAYGERLAYGARVGVGSVCKRNSHPAIIEYLLRGIKADRPDLRLHGFGLKHTALQRQEIRGLLYSADSMAWTYAAWREGRDNHDWREAEAYRKKIDEPDTKLELWN